MTPDQKEFLAKLHLLEEVVTDLEPLLIQNAHWIGLKFLDRFRHAALHLADSCEAAKSHA